MSVVPDAPREPIRLEGVTYEGRPGPTAGDWLDEANAAFRVNDWERTYFAAREVLTQSPGAAAAWVLRGRASFMLGRLSDSEQELRQAVRLRPADAHPHAVLADTLEARDRWPEALLEIDEAIRLDPDAWLYGISKGSFYLNAGRSREAIKQFEEVLKRPTDGTGFAATFLARALYQDAYSTWTKLPNGEHIITNLEQVRRTRQNAERALTLNIEDDDLRSSLQRGLMAANGAEVMRWVPAANPLGYGVGLIVALVAGLVGLASGQIGGILFGFLCLVACAAIVYAYVRRHRKPVWMINAETARLRGARA